MERCSFVGCKRKLKLIDVHCRCRCGFLFCYAHKFSDVHNCSFDYKGDHMQKLISANPVVEQKKIDKI